MISFRVNDYLDSSKDISTIFQYCAKNFIHLPCFCYHEKLTIAGNCRMCLVQANNALVVSCAVTLLNDMYIYTDNKRVRLARESVLELLLINHPLDCPICDQGGECDLQDISMVYGTDRARFTDTFKRAVANVNNCGPCIKTIMTRCIHCTRCVRFFNEICSTNSLGTVGRGVSMEIGTYIEDFIDHELSANVIDLCPVGALTSMPYAFNARPWEAISYSNVDVLDALAASVRLDVVQNKVIRILPLLNEQVNEEWITNKSRYVYDIYSTNRQLKPIVSVLGKLVTVSWELAFDLYQNKLFSLTFTKLRVIFGPASDLEAVVSLKAIFNLLGSSNFNVSGNSLSTDTDWSHNYLLTAGLTSLEDTNFLLALGLYFRLDLPLLMVRLKRAYNSFTNAVFLNIGATNNELFFPIGITSKALVNLVEGCSQVAFAHISTLCHYYHNNVLTTAINPLLLSSFSSHIGASKNTILSNMIELLCDAGISVSKGTLANHLVQTNLAELQIDTLNNSDTGVGFCHKYHTDDNSKVQSKVLDDFMVTQSPIFSMDGFFNSCNLFLPSLFHIEKDCTFLNLEGVFRIGVPVTCAYRRMTDKAMLKSLFFYIETFCIQRFSIATKYFSTLIRFFNNILSHNIYVSLNYIEFRNFLYRRYGVWRETHQSTHFKALSMPYSRLHLLNTFSVRNSVTGLDKYSRNISIINLKIAYSNKSLLDAVKRYAVIGL